jgi:hypothetical protein
VLLLLLLLPLLLLLLASALLLLLAGAVLLLLLLLAGLMTMLPPSRPLLLLLLPLLLEWPLCCRSCHVNLTTGATQAARVEPLITLPGQLTSRLSSTASSASPKCHATSALIEARLLLLLHATSAVTEARLLLLLHATSALTEAQLLLLLLHATSALTEAQLLLLLHATSALTEARLLLALGVLGVPATSAAGDAALSCCSLSAVLLAALASECSRPTRQGRALRQGCSKCWLVLTHKARLKLCGMRFTRQQCGLSN